MTLLIVTCVSGCAPYRIRQALTPQYATLVNRDVVISAVDADWELRAGTTIPAVMFQRSLTPVEFARAVLDNEAELGRLQADGYKQVAGTPYAHAVNIRRGTEAYFGLLMLRNVDPDAIPAAQARWAIEIPEEFFAGARNGGISYVRGTYTRSGSNVTLTHWILWFSDFRFW